MPSTSDYLTQLQTDKTNLVSNLNTMGVEASNNETFTSLAPKVLDIQSGDSGIQINGTEVTMESDGSVSAGDFVTMTNLTFSNIGTSLNTTTVSDFYNDAIELSADLYLIVSANNGRLYYKVVRLETNNITDVVSTTSLVNDAINSKIKTIKTSDNKILISYTTTSSTSNANPSSMIYLLCNTKNDNTLEILDTKVYTPASTSFSYLELLEVSNNMFVSINNTTHIGIYLILTIENNEISIKTDSYNATGLQGLLTAYYFKSYPIGNNMFVALTSDVKIGYSNDDYSSGHARISTIKVNSDYTLTVLQNKLAIDTSTDGIYHVSVCGMIGNRLFVLTQKANPSASTKYSNSTIISAVLVDNTSATIPLQIEQNATCYSAYGSSICINNKNQIIFVGSSTYNSGQYARFGLIEYDSTNATFTQITKLVPQALATNTYTPGGYLIPKIYLTGSNRIFIEFPKSSSVNTLLVVLNNIGNFAKTITTSTETVYGVALESKNSGENIKVIKP